MSVVLGVPGSPEIRAFMFPPSWGSSLPALDLAASGLPGAQSLGRAVVRGFVSGCDWMFGWGHQAEWPIRRWGNERGLGLCLVDRWRLAGWEGSNRQSSQWGDGGTSRQWVCPGKASCNWLIVGDHWPIKEVGKPEWNGFRTGKAGCDWLSGRRAMGKAANREVGEPLWRGRPGQVVVAAEEGERRGRSRRGAGC